MRIDDHRMKTDDPTAQVDLAPHIEPQLEDQRNGGAGRANDVDARRARQRHEHTEIRVEQGESRNLQPRDLERGAEDVGAGPSPKDGAQGVHGVDRIADRVVAEQGIDQRAAAELGLERRNISRSVHTDQSPYPADGEAKTELDPGSEASREQGQQ